MKPGTNMAPVPMHVLEPNQNADFGELKYLSFVSPKRTSDTSSLPAPHVKNNFPTEKMHVYSIQKDLIIKVQQIFEVTRVCGFHIPT